MKVTIFVAALFSNFICGRVFGEITLPYLQAPTESSIYITWKTDVNANSSVQFGATQALGQFASVSTEAIESDYFWHTAKIGGLSPNTPYYYKAITGNEETEIFRFRTQPDPSVKTGHYRILLYGDSRGPKHRDIVAAAINKISELYGSPLEDHLNIAVNTGDIVGNGLNNNYQGQHFSWTQDLSPNIPYAISIGNHEQESPLYYQHFVQDDNLYKDQAGPDGEKYFAIQCGRIVFFLMNSNSSVRIQSQIQWFDQMLAVAEADPNVDWVFVLAHHPNLCEQNPPDGTAWVRDDLIPTMEKYSKVSLFGSGHAHVYHRGALIDNNIINILSGSAGAGIQRWFKDPYVDYVDIQKTFDVWNYLLIDIDIENQSFTGEVYSLGHEDRNRDNELMDTFYRKKINTSPPIKPFGEYPIGNYNQTTIALRGTPYSGVEEWNSSQFQVRTETGSYGDSLISVKRDIDNFYYDTGEPNWEPIDYNLGININVLTVDLAPNSSFFWRVRYRDKNLQWSEWSMEQPVTTYTIAPDGLFIESPKGGEKILGGSKQMIEWKSQGTVSDVTISISNEQFSTEIVTRINDGSYEWTVPDIVADSNVIRITANGGDIISESDVFQIIDNTSLFINKNYPITKFSIAGIPKDYHSPFEANEIRIFDLNGKMINKFIEPTQNLNWNKLDESGRMVPPGIYLVNFLGNKKRYSFKVSLIH